MDAPAPLGPPTDPHRPLILVTNDDGIQAPGIRALAESLYPLGEVWVLAPDRNRSGVSHMISLMRPLRCSEVQPRWWQIDGSPADCVYLGIHSMLPRRPSLVMSGINAGPNLSYDVHYSGTVGAAQEGTLLGVPSIAVSLTHVRTGSYELAARFARELAARVLEDGLPGNVTLNVNVPGGAPDRYQLTVLGHRLFRHSVEKRDDPRGSPYYWIGGEPDAARDIPGSDCNAVAAGVISVTPLAVDHTDRDSLVALGTLDVPGHARVAGRTPPEDAPPGSG
jgi:5'-nucleotidase